MQISGGLGRKLLRRRRQCQVQLSDGLFDNDFGVVGFGVRKIHGRRSGPRCGRHQMGHRLLAQSHQRPRPADHNCWQRPEDMDTPRTAYAVSKNFPGSEVSAEITAALAAASLVFRPSDREYSARLLKRARTVFDFANQCRGSYNQSLGPSVCNFYCDYSGHEGAAWLYRATKAHLYWDFIVHNIKNLEIHPIVNNIDGTPFVGGSFAKFGWDAKHAGIYVLVSKLIMNNPQYQEPFVSAANKFVCSVLPESPSVLVQYSPGGLLVKPGGSSMQHVTALSFLLLVHARTSNQANNMIKCGSVAVPTSRLVKIARQQVDYILGTNPSNLSYMVGYGAK